MKRREAERALQAAGFVRTTDSKHIRYTKGDLRVTLHLGDKVTHRQAAAVRSALRRAV